MIFQGLSSIDMIIILCWLTVIAALIIAGILLIKKSKDKQDRIRIYLLAAGIFFLCYSINRIIFFIHELIFDPFIWTLPMEKYNEIMLGDSFRFSRYDIIWRISTAFGTYGLLIFLIAFESQILEKKTKFIFSIIQGVTATLSIILGAAGDVITLGRIILYIGLKFSSLKLPKYFMSSSGRHLHPLLPK